MLLNNIYSKFPRNGARGHLIIIIVIIIIIITTNDFTTQHIREKLYIID